jgi:hypothetical protein
METAGSFGLHDNGCNCNRTSRGNHRNRRYNDLKHTIDEADETFTINNGAGNRNIVDNDNAPTVTESHASKRDRRAVVFDFALSNPAQ